jgi:hypothetical protein
MAANLSLPGATKLDRWWVGEPQSQTLSSVVPVSHRTYLGTPLPGHEPQRTGPGAGRAPGHRFAVTARKYSAAVPPDAARPGVAAGAAAASAVATMIADANCGDSRMSGRRLGA